MSEFYLDQLKQGQDFSAFILSVFLCVAIHVHTHMCTVCPCVCALGARAHPCYQLDLEELHCTRLTADKPPDLATPNNSYSQDYHTFPLHAFKDRTYRTYATFIWRKKRNILKS